MSGAAAIIIATEEEEAESQALRTTVQGKSTFPKELDEDLAALALEVDELRDKCITMRARVEAEAS